MNKQVKEIMSSDLELSEKIDRVVEVASKIYDRINELTNRKHDALREALNGTLPHNEYIEIRNQIREELPVLEKEQVSTARQLKKLLNQYC